MLGLADVLMILFVLVPFMLGWIMRGRYDELEEDRHEIDLQGKKWD